MFHVDEFRDTLILKMSADKSLLEKAMEHLEVFLKHAGIGPHQGTYIVVRELLDNAIEHGNANHPDGEVHLEVVNLGKDRLNVVVEDEGNGFDWATLEKQTTADERATCGYPLIKTVTDDFEFNQKGNRVLAHISLHDEAWLTLTRKGQEAFLHPSRNLTDAIAENLRLKLLELLSQDYKAVHFDLSEVKDIHAQVLHIMLVFAKMIEDKDVQLKISGANDDIANLFHFTHMDELYSVVEAT